MTFVTLLLLPLLASTPSVEASAVSGAPAVADMACAPTTLSYGVGGVVQAVAIPTCETATAVPTQEPAGEPAL